MSRPIDELGGDPPCWAHLFAETGCSAEPHDHLAAGHPAPACNAVVDFANMALTIQSPGAAWTRRSEDLDLNLLVFPRGEGVASHVNDEVDVLLVGVTGRGVVKIDSAGHDLHSGQLLIIPKGARRQIRSLSDLFIYLSVHRRRAGITPTR